MNYIILNGTEPVQISEKKAKFFSLLCNETETKSIVKQLKLIERIALYDSCTMLGITEKNALFAFHQLISNLKE